MASLPTRANGSKSLSKQAFLLNAGQQAFAACYHILIGFFKIPCVPRVIYVDADGVRRLIDKDGVEVATLDGEE